MTQSIGKSLTRLDVRDKVTGEALYPGDINKPNQAYLKILFAHRPHAIVKNIDTTAAEAVEGVIAVYTAKDVPVNEYGLGENDQPVLCGPGSDKPFADRVRFVGDQVAVVVAETPKIAEQAVKLIAVDYQDLPVVTDPREARQPGADLLHPDRGTNVISHLKIRKGDLEDAFAQADVIIAGEYETPMQEHAYLQPEAGLAYIDDHSRITVEVAGQWTHEDQEQIAHALGLPAEQVRVIYPVIGGAFGGREDMSIQIVLALAAYKLYQLGINRPVKTIWSREESIIGHHKRHAYFIKTRWGADNEGNLLAAEVEIVADAGAYIYTSPKVLGNATLMCTGPYEIPAVKVDSYAVYTNHVPGGAFRGFGGPQGAFAAEQQMNKLAAALKMDPVEIRMKNILRDGSLLSTGTPMPKSVSMPEVVEECARVANWPQGRPQTADQAKSPIFTPQSPIRRGLGFACGFKNIGFSFGYQENCTATIELHGGVDIERAVIRHAAAEVGQGTHQAIVQMTAEALDIPVDVVEWDFSDTASSGNAGSVSASRMTFMSGNSVKGAVDRALDKWEDEERPAIATYKYLAPKTTSLDPETGESTPNFAYGYVAQAVEVEVDTETGFVRIVDVISANDVGKAINPQQVVGQTEGAVVQAAGYALMENFIQKDGYVLTPQLSTYLIPTVLDVPDKVETVILEYPDPNGPWGARGMGEMPYIPLTPAITAAIYAATGVWFDDFPLTPERVLRGLGKI
jgi:CO/xanthine dehydrogenase Mo-binding subunit